MIIIAALVLLNIAAMAAGRQNTVMWNDVKTVLNATNSLDIKKVELTDTAAILTVHAQYAPGGKIQIAAGSFLRDMQGRKYELRGADGIVPGKWLTLSDTGECDFILRFAPMPVNTVMFDFLESEADDAWKLFGICNADNMPPSDRPAVADVKKAADNETLPSTKEMREGTIVFSCKAYGYRPEMKAVMKCRYSAPGSRNQKSVSARFRDDGTVTLNIETASPLKFYANIVGLAGANVVAVPGDTITCVTDLLRPDDFIFTDFTGRLARTNNELGSWETRKKIISMITCDKEMVEGMTGCDTKGCAAFLNDRLKKDISTVNAMPLTDAAKQLLRMELESNSLDWRYDFRKQWIDARFNIERENIKTREDYDRFMKQDHGIPAVISPLTVDMPDMECLNADYALFDNTLLSMSGKGTELPLIDSFFKQLTVANAYLCGVDGTAEKAERTVTDACLKRLVNEKRDNDRRTEEELAQRKNIFYKAMDDVKPEDILPAILARYAGKAVFVDIWATWCGPCKAGHKQMVPLKEEMKGKDVVFVYITGPSSPVQTWKEMVKDIDGEQYYLTQEQYYHILKQYESRGIPTYLLFDRKGSLTFKNIGSKDNNTFRREIEKAMRQ